MIFRRRAVNVAIAFKTPQVDNSAACHAGLGVTARSIALSLSDHRIAAASLPVANGEGLWAHLAGEGSSITHLVFCAPYIDAPFLGRLVRNFPAIKFALAYHSNVGFLTVDKFATGSLPKFLQLQQDCPNFSVAANSRALCDAVEQGMGRDCVYLPNLYHLTGPVVRSKPRWNHTHPLHIGLFGATRVLKNPLTAAWASLVMQRELGVPVYLHVSTGREEGGGSALENVTSILENSPVTLARAPWMNWDDFRRYIYGMDVMLQPSFTESFNNVTADGVNCGVPSVVSEAITWAPHNWMANSDSVTDVARVGLDLLCDKNAPAEGYAALAAYNDEGYKSWSQWLS